MGYGRGGGRGGQQYDNNMKGALFENKEKRRGKQDPDMRGSCEIDGVEYWVNAWWNNSDNVGDYLSFKLQAKDGDNGFEGGGGRGNNERGASRGGGNRAGAGRDSRPAGGGYGGGGARNAGGGGRGPSRDPGMDDELDDIPY